MAESTDNTAHRNRSGGWRLQWRAGLGALMLAGMLALGADLALAPAEGIAGIGKAAHLNVAVFHVHTGKKPPAEITGEDEIALLTALKGQARMLGYMHSTGMKDGDVVLLATDVMREEGGKVADFGVDCELIVHVANGEKVSIGGKCEVEVWDMVNKRRVSDKLIIKPEPVGDHWTLIGWSEVEHIAIYVDEEIGAE
ncbi:MAG: hypothetical protein R8K47_03900 [Mariprofundaceae bacterium]